MYIRFTEKGMANFLLGIKFVIYCSGVWHMNWNLKDHQVLARHIGQEREERSRVRAELVHSTGWGNTEEKHREALNIYGVWYCSEQGMQTWFLKYLIYQGREFDFSFNQIETT